MEKNQDFAWAMSLTNASLDWLRGRISLHERAIDSLRARLVEAQVAREALLELIRRHRVAVQRRWSLRQQLRTARDNIEHAQGVHLRSIARAQKATVNNFLFAARETFLSKILAVAAPIPQHFISSGVYFLFRGNDLIYIGRADKVEARVTDHIGNKKFDRVAYIPVQRSRLSVVERRLIDLYLPPCNSDTRTLSLRGD